jgi:hypothetical protein
MRPPAALNICFFVTLLAPGCRWSGGSYPSAYEGEVRFEHCYRLDEQFAEAPEVRRRCWHDWIRSYTYGQSRDRVDYAVRRERALADAQANGTHAPPANTTVDPARVAGQGSPVPTSAFASPPPTLPHDAGTDDAALASAVALTAAPDPPEHSAPGAACARSCWSSWLQCGQRCKGNACQSSCNTRYRACMRRCF